MLPATLIKLHSLDAYNIYFYVNIVATVYSSVIGQAGCPIGDGV